MLLPGPLSNSDADLVRGSHTDTLVVLPGPLSNSDADKVQGSHTDTLVVLARLFSNSAPPTLTRALSAYGELGLKRPPVFGQVPKL